MDLEQKCFGETQSINEAAFEYLSKSNEADILLIAGDLSFNGEKESHKAFSAMLKDFKEKTGKQVFVVTAGHDCNEKPFAFNETGRLAPEGTSFDELYDIQRKIIRNGAEYVRKGGCLVYSTCTLNKHENEEIIADFLRDNKEFEKTYEKTFYPHIDGCDGFFICRLNKK